VTTATLGKSDVVGVAVVCATGNVASTIDDVAKHVVVLMAQAGRSWSLLLVDDSDDDAPSALAHLAADGYPLRSCTGDRRRGSVGTPGRRFGGCAGRTIAVIDVGTPASAAVVVQLLDEVDRGADVAS
jgi:hypothetical protein